MASFEWGDRPPRLPGRRLELRELTSRDAPGIFAIFGDPEVVRFWSSPPLVGVAAAADMIQRIQGSFAERRLFQWGIGAPETGDLLGTCSLLHLDREHRRAEVGIALGRPAWGRGLATEALELLIGFSYRTLGLHRLEADIDPDNQRSLRLFERQGFRREGYLRERWHHLGQVLDAVFLGLLRHEWPGTQALAGAARSFQGRIRSGTGKAAHWLGKLNDAYARKTGMAVFPGSLNVAVHEPFDWFDRRWQTEIVWFGREESGGERDILLLPCRLSEAPALPAFLWSTTTAARDPADRNVVEIIAPVNLRSTYRLEDGDPIGIEVLLKG